MDGVTLRDIRKELGLSLTEFGRALGYKGNNNTLNKHVRQMEIGQRPVMPAQAQKARELLEERRNP